MKLKYEFAIQQVGDSYVAVAINSSADAFKGMIKLNETGKRIFELLAEPKTLDEILKVFDEEYAGDAAKIHSSVATYIETLKSNHLIEE